DPRVTVLERKNVRALRCSELPFAPTFVTCDVSFVGLAKALPPALACAAPGWRAVALVKPQLEAGGRDVGKGGGVRAPAVRRRARRGRRARGRRAEAARAPLAARAPDARLRRQLRPCRVPDERRRKRARARASSRVRRRVPGRRALYPRRGDRRPHGAGRER